MNDLNGYNLSRAWFDFAFENQDKVNSTHTAMYCWFIELNNRMGWVEKFASPASQTMAAIGVRSYNTYKKTFNELVSFGFVKVVKKSENQYQSCIIALSKFDKSLDKSLDKSVTNHLTNHVHITRQITSSINKPINNKQQTIKPINERKKFAPPNSDDVNLFFIEKIIETKWSLETCKIESKKFIDFYSSKNWMIGKNKMTNWKSAASGWINRSENFNNGKKDTRSNPTARIFGKL